MTFQRKFSLQKVDDFLASDAADSFTQIFGEFFEIKKFRLFLRQVLFL